ncbi:MAG: aldose epimerase family protein, partial [Planctomycetota bacterium]
PGTVDVVVTYTLTNGNALNVDVSATTDRATPVNVVHHSYWNLAGHDSGDVLEHELMLRASRYTPADETLIPTGAIEPVAGTPLDFTTPKPIGRDIDQVPEALRGYDHNLVVDGEPGTMRLAARVRDPGSGRVMEIHTTEPGIQFYTGNFLDDVPGKGGAVYAPRQGFCLETQRFPDTINKEGTPGWPTVVLRPGQTYRHLMVHRFLVD